MAQKNRTDLQVQAKEIKDEVTVDANSANRVGTMHEDQIDSAFNKTDDDAAQVPYTPAVGGDWPEGVPNNTASGLDTLAGRAVSGSGAEFRNSSGTPVAKTIKTIYQEIGPWDCVAQPTLGVTVTVPALPDNIQFLEVSSVIFSDLNRPSFTEGYNSGDELPGSTINWNISKFSVGTTSIQFSLNAQGTYLTGRFESTAFNRGFVKVVYFE